VDGRKTFCAKTLDFFKFIVHPHGQEMEASADKEGGASFFRDFVRTSFMDGP